MDAVFNIGRTAFVVEALRTGDLELLGKVMDDRLHQPYRLKLIPGGEAVFMSARRAGAAAVALSGAGPTIIAFCPPDGEPGMTQSIAMAMVDAFDRAGVLSRRFVLSSTMVGAHVITAG